MKYIVNRLGSDRGESTTISQMMWIVLTVVIVLAVGGAIYKAVTAKTAKVAKCIEDSNTLFGSGKNCK